MRVFGFLILSGIMLSSSASAQTRDPIAPVSVSLCDLLKSPKTFDKKLVQVRGKVNLEFEDFGIYDTSCNTWPSIWLMFGGDIPTPTKSTWNDTSRTKGENIKVGGIEYKIVNDEKLDEFRKGIMPGQGFKPIHRVTATLVGTFLAGRSKEEAKTARMPAFPGYGHMGCCYLLIIQQVLTVETKPITVDAQEKWTTRQKSNP